jgi:DNA-binding response OmpR family regulator
MPDVLLATDADWIHDEVDAALADDDTTVLRVTAGRDVLPAVDEHDPDLIVLDLQIGNMGGMATCLGLRLEEGAGRLERRPVLMLLDRSQDVFLARRSDADGWLVKPLDAFRLRRAATALLAGGEWHEGLPDDQTDPVEAMVPVVSGTDESVATTTAEAAVVTAEAGD